MTLLGKTMNVAETTKHFAVYYPLGKTLWIKNYDIASWLVTSGPAVSRAFCAVAGSKWKLRTIEMPRTYGRVVED